MANPKAILKKALQMKQQGALPTSKATTPQVQPPLNDIASEASQDKKAALGGQRVFAGLQR